MIVKLLTEHHLEFLSLKGGCRGSSETTLVKMSNCWKSHAAAQKSAYILGVVKPRSHEIARSTNRAIGHESRRCKTCHDY